MKTNHQRGFKDRRGPRAVFRCYVVGGSLRRAVLSDRTIAAGATCGDHTKGKRGIAKDVRGAKKFVRSRFRFHENQALRQQTLKTVSEKSPAMS